MFSVDEDRLWLFLNVLIGEDGAKARACSVMSRARTLVVANFILSIMYNAFLKLSLDELWQVRVKSNCYYNKKERE